MGHRGIGTLASVAAVAAVIAVPAVGTAPAVASDPPGIAGIIDLGALPGDTDSKVSGLNSAGTIVGQSDTGYWYNPTAVHAVTWSPAGVIAALALPPGDTDPNSLAAAVNDTGVIVGYSYGGGTAHALRWAPDGTVAALPALPGDIASYAGAIAPDGTVIGRSSSPTGAEHAVRWSPDGTVTDLGNLGGDTYTYAVGINAGDTVVGYSYSSGMPATALRWAPDGTVTNLAPLVGSNVIINEGGVLAGVGGANHGIRVNPDGGVVDLGRWASPAAINAGGTIAGGFRPDIKRKYAASWAPDGTVTNLRPLPADSNCWAAALNGAGTVVGFSSVFTSPYSEQTHAVSWARDGSVTALGSLPGGTFSSAGNINSAGTIAGASETSAGHLHAVVWRR